MRTWRRVFRAHLPAVGKTGCKPFMLMIEHQLSSEKKSASQLHLWGQQTECTQPVHLQLLCWCAYSCSLGVLIGHLSVRPAHTLMKQGYDALDQFAGSASRQERRTESATMGKNECQYGDGQ